MVASCGVLLIGAIAPAANVIHVPRGAPVVIDGRIDEAEWRHAAVQRLSDGSVLRLLHDERSLFLGITATRQGYPSVCIAHDGSVRVFHASAALGSVTYTQSTTGWITHETEFAYGMRTPDLTDPAREERRAYLARHGWLASTVRMGNGRMQELQISLDLISRASTLALGYFVMGSGDAGAVMAWPESLSPDEGCADDTLVRGHVPPRLHFDPARWASLRLDP